MRMLEACDQVARFGTVTRRDRPCAKAAIARFLPATVIEWRSGDTWLAWLAATPQTLATRSPAEFEAAAVAAVASGIHFVVVTNRHLSLVNQGDLERANDVKRRRHAGLVDTLVVTEDDVFVEEVERRLRVALALALEEAPSTDVCRQLGLPTCDEVDVVTCSLRMAGKPSRGPSSLRGRRAVCARGRSA
jgi:hypothetical protein